MSNIPPVSNTSSLASSDAQNAQILAAAALILAQLAQSAPSAGT